MDGRGNDLSEIKFYRESNFKVANKYLRRRKIEIKRAILSRVNNILFDINNLLLILSRNEFCYSRNYLRFFFLSTNEEDNEQTFNKRKKKECVIPNFNVLIVEKQCMEGDKPRATKKKKKKSKKLSRRSKH